MKAQMNITAARARMKSRLLRLHIDSLEGFVEKRRAEALAAIADDDWGFAAERCKAAAEHQAEITQRWTTINDLRKVIDEGTTHIEEERDYA